MYSRVIRKEVFKKKYYAKYTNKQKTQKSVGIKYRLPEEYFSY